MAGNFNLVSVLGLLWVFTLVHKLVTVSGQNIPAVALFTFGDSYFDAGNRKFLTSATLAQNFWPYGKSRDDPNGKYSDGKIAPDFLAKFMGIPHDIPPALKPGVNVSRGASFAVDYASLFGYTKDSLTLNQQVRKFNKMISNWKADYIQKSVFMIHIGMEDYYNFSMTNPSASVSAQQTFVDSVINKLKNDIGLLYASGASKFVIQMLPPIGCLPIVRQDVKTGNECHEKFNDLAKTHNAKLGPMLNEMAKAKPGFQFTVFDFYNVILRRTQRRMDYRFSETNISCCGVGTHNAYGCGFPNVHTKLCEYQRSYLYFDARHNTEKAQESFAHLLFGADPNVIQPMNVRELIVYPVNDPMREYWKVPTEEELSSVNDLGVDASG